MGLFLDLVHLCRVIDGGVFQQSTEVAEPPCAVRQILASHLGDDIAYGTHG